MFKKLNFKSLDYKDLEKFESHDFKRDKIKTFYQTFDFLELVRKWPEIIGPQLSKVTSPLKISGDCLIIVSQHASYSQNISFLSEEIKKKIFNLFPELKLKIKKINFLTNETYFRNQTPSNQPTAIPKKVSHHPQDPKFKILKKEAETMFCDIEDQDLFNLLVSIYVQMRYL